MAVINLQFCSNVKCMPLAAALRQYAFVCNVYNVKNIDFVYICSFVEYLFHVHCMLVIGCIYHCNNLYQYFYFQMKLSWPLC